MILESKETATRNSEVDPNNGTAAYRIIKDLAADLSSGDLNLPSLPEVVVLIRAALDRDDCDSEQIADLVASEPILAGTLLKIANSVTYRRSGAETASLVTSVARLGMKLVRSVSIQFALQQLRKAEDFRCIQHLLDPEWERSHVVAGLCHALARHTRRAHPDEMLTLGLVHNIGRIYILSRDGVVDEIGAGNYDEVLDEWHPIIGSAIAESWNLPEQAAQAIGQQCTPDDQQDFAHDTNDLLGLAVAIAAAEQTGELEPEAILALPQAKRLNVNETMLASVREEARDFGELLAE